MKNYITLSAMPQTVFSHKVVANTVLLFFCTNNTLICFHFSLPCTLCKQT